MLGRKKKVALQLNSKLQSSYFTLIMIILVKSCNNNTITKILKAKYQTLCTDKKCGTGYMIVQYSIHSIFNIFMYIYRKVTHVHIDN